MRQARVDATVCSVPEPGDARWWFGMLRSGTLPWAVCIILIAGSVRGAYAQADPQQADSLFGAQEWAAAAAAYEAQTKMADDNGRTWFRLGIARARLGAFEDAISAFEKANALEFALPQVRYQLASAHVQAGDTDAAFKWLHAATDAGFTNLGVLRNDPVLEPLRKLPGFAAVVRATEAGHPCNRDECRQFDFWAGHWDVFSAAGAQVGTNRIERAENACVLRENWTSTRGTTGSSINFYHPGRRKWVQTWTDGSGGVIDLEGELRDGAMHLVGTNTLADGSSELSRGTWTPLADGRVRQFFEQSRDDGETWYVWFDGYYVRQKAEARRD